MRGLVVHVVLLSLCLGPVALRAAPHHHHEHEDDAGHVATAHAGHHTERSPRAPFGDGPSLAEICHGDACARCGVNAVPPEIRVHATSAPLTRNDAPAAPGHLRAGHDRLPSRPPRAL